MSIGVWIISRCGKMSALVDAVDQDLAATTWYAGRKGFFLSFPPGYRRDPAIRYVALHRAVLERACGPAQGNLRVADHINRDTSDNRRSNLRWVTYTQSNWNRRGSSKTGYKGVVRRHNCKYKVFGAVIEHNGRVHHLGGFYTAEDAARAYDRVALKFGAGFAVLNFPEDVDA